MRGVNMLPILILLSFPLLYSAGQAGNSCNAFAGIVLLFAGMAGPLLKRMLEGRRDRT